MLGSCTGRQDRGPQHAPCPPERGLGHWKEAGFDPKAANVGFSSEKHSLCCGGGERSLVKRGDFPRLPQAGLRLAFRGVTQVPERVLRQTKAAPHSASQLLQGDPAGPRCWPRPLPACNLRLPPGPLPAPAPSSRRGRSQGGEGRGSRLPAGKAGEAPPGGPARNRPQPRGCPPGPPPPPPPALGRAAARSRPSRLPPSRAAPPAAGAGPASLPPPAPASPRGGRQPQGVRGGALPRSPALPSRACGTGRGERDAGREAARDPGPGRGHSAVPGSAHGARRTAEDARRPAEALTAPPAGRDSGPGRRGAPRNGLRGGWGGRGEPGGPGACTAPARGPGADLPPGPRCVLAEPAECGLEQLGSLRGGRRSLPRGTAPPGDRSRCRCPSGASLKLVQGGGSCGTPRSPRSPRGGKGPCPASPRRRRPKELKICRAAAAPAGPLLPPAHAFPFDGPRLLPE